MAQCQNSICFQSVTTPEIFLLIQLTNEPDAQTSKTKTVFAIGNRKKATESAKMTPTG